MPSRLNAREIIGKIWSKSHHGLLINTLRVKLALKGIIIQPYFLVQEQLFENLGKQFETGFEEFETGFLEPEDMCSVSTSRKWSRTEKHYLKLLEEGKKCFGVKCNSELAAFMWVDLKECNFDSNRFALKQDCAYLFDAWTLEHFRGRRIAPYMRYQCYKALNQLGRNKYYSITEYFNTPAAKFKKRLGAKNIKLGLVIKLFGKYHWVWELKRYE